MSKAFREAVLEWGLSLDKLGRVFIVAILSAFTISAFVVKNERDHAEFRQLQALETQKLTQHTAEFVALSLQMQTLTTEVRRDQDLANERRESAQQDRARMQRMLEQLLERQ